MRAFLDTNVVLDFVCKREPFHADASKIFVMHERGELICILSSLTIINSAYILRKIFRKDEILSVITWLCNDFLVSAIDRNNIVDAVKRDAYDFEDTVQFYSAQSYHPDVIITRDKKGFANADIPVLTPAEFIEESRKRHK